MYQSYKWHQDRRTKRHIQESQQDLTALTQESVAKQAYNVWHLGILAKQASMMNMLLQDSPFLIESCMMEIKLGLAAFITLRNTNVVYSQAFIRKSLILQFIFSKLTHAKSKDLIGTYCSLL